MNTHLHFVRLFLFFWILVCSQEPAVTLAGTLTAISNFPTLFYFWTSFFHLDFTQIADFIDLKICIYIKESLFSIESVLVRNTRHDQDCKIFYQKNKLKIFFIGLFLISLVLLIKHVMREPISGLHQHMKRSSSTSNQNNFVQSS